MADKTKDPLDIEDIFAPEDLASFGRSDIPDRLTTEDDVLGPKTEPPFNISSYRPESKERRVVFEMLQIEGMTLKMASRAMEVCVQTFRKAFSREIFEAARVRAQMNPGEDFRPMNWHRSWVMSGVAAGLKPEQICGIMFRGNMEMSRFNAFFGHELSMGTESVVALCMDRLHRIVKSGNDKDAGLNARALLKYKGVGNFRDTTRYDHDTHVKEGEENTADQLAATERAMVEELMTSGVEPEAAKAMIRMLSGTGKGPLARAN
jgi:hypothetical protein